MRTLTVTRTKSFVGCLAKLQIFIEDPTASDITINSVPCRKLGNIKNGETVSFEIGEGAARVFVIADNLSRNWCNEFYQLPEGSEDISLSGRCKFNPAAGNAFLFDNNDTYEAYENRTQNKKRGTVVIILAIIIGFAIGFLLSYNLFPLLMHNSEPKDFTADGMTITLTNEFSEASADLYSAVYESESIAVFVFKESFSSSPALKKKTLDEYMDMLIDVNDFESKGITKTSNPKGFVYDYTNPETGDTYRYFSYVYQSEDAFWFVQFATLAADADNYKQQILTFANSVKFE